MIRENIDWVSAFVTRNLQGDARRLAETQDFVQTSMRRLLARRSAFVISSQSAFRKLVATIVRNRMRSVVRKFHTEQRSLQDLAADNDSDITGVAPSLGSLTDSSGQDSDAEEAAVVSLAMDLLDGPQQDVLHLREWDNLGFAEIGRTLGVSEDAARMRHKRAVRELTRKVRAIRSGQLT